MVNYSIDLANIIQAIAAVVMIFFAAMQWYIQRMQQKQDAFHIKYNIYKKILEIYKIIVQNGGLGRITDVKVEDKNNVYILLYELENELGLVFSLKAFLKLKQYNDIILKFDHFITSDDYYSKRSENFTEFRSIHEELISILKTELSLN